MRAALIVASGRDPDMAYATGFDCPDPFPLLVHRGRKSILLPDLEIDRARAKARVDEVLSLSDWEAKAGGARRGNHTTLAGVLALFLESRRISCVEVPSGFPLGLARELEARSIRVNPRRGLFFPEREFKRADEIAKIRAILRITEAAVARGIDILAGSEITKNGRLKWAGKSLTSEILRSEIDCVSLRLGGLGEGTIVACGEQACDPHERGFGPLKAHVPVIIDHFPRHLNSGYFGDLTRTVVRGTAPEPLRRMWQVVRDGQNQALRALKPGRQGSEIHRALQQTLKAAGYPTEIRGGRWVGFFHGTGHALGLELHESPRFAKTVLKPGQVFTVEPGLYYPGVGGVRHEDVAVITQTGRRLLSSLPHRLEI